MSILHVVESLERGGLERVVVDLATEQKIAGHDVAVCCLFRRGLLADELERHEISVHTINKRGGFDLKAIKRIRSLIRDFGADVVHSHNAVANYYSALASLFISGMKLINTRHGMGGSDLSSRKERLYRMSLTRTSAVAAVCAHAARHFVAKDLVPKRLVNVVLNGIRVERFEKFNSESRHRSRSSLGIADDALVIGTVGRLNWAKDHTMLIESFGRLERGGSDRLVIVGDGELRDDLEQLVDRLGLKDNVMFLGDRSDIAQLLAGFDIFALTSITEGYSIALLEAAAAGLAIVASDVGGNSEIVCHDETGLLVEPRTVDGFTGAFARLQADPGLRSEMGCRAAQWAQCNASLGSMVRAYDALYMGRTPPVSPLGEVS